jgi:hypothetical protein
VTGQEQRGTGTSAVGSRYEKAGEDCDWGNCCLCKSSL